MEKNKPILKSKNKIDFNSKKVLKGFEKARKMKEVLNQLSKIDIKRLSEPASGADGSVHLSPEESRKILQMIQKGF